MRRIIRITHDVEGSKCPIDVPDLGIDKGGEGAVERQETQAWVGQLVDELLSNRGGGHAQEINITRMEVLE